MYEYRTGSQFKHRVEAICEQFQTIQEEFAKEHTAMGRQWAKREKQIQAVIDNTVSLYSDLEGIAGQCMPQIEELELDLLANEEENEKKLKKILLSILKPQNNFPNFIKFPNKGRIRKGFYYESFFEFPYPETTGFIYR